MSGRGVEHLAPVVEGLRTPMLVAGPSSVPEAVLFVHGNPGSGEEFSSLVSTVGEFCRVVAPDMPGYGRADKPADFDYSVGGYVRHLSAVLTAADVRRVHLVLHDFGGLWGLRWAAEHADRVASITLINVGVLLGYRWHYLARIWRTPILGEAFMATATRPAMRLMLRHGNPRGLPDAFFDRMWENFDRATRRGVLRLYRATADPAALSLDVHAALRPHRIPALVVWGARDPYIPVDFAYRQKETFPDAQVVVLDQSGHWPHADDAPAVAAAVVPFLRARTSRSEASG